MLSLWVGSALLVQFQASLRCIAVARRDGRRQAETDRAILNFEDLGVIQLNDHLVPGQDVADIGGVQIFT